MISHTLHDRGAGLARALAQYRLEIRLIQKKSAAGAHRLHAFVQVRDDVRELAARDAVHGDDGALGHEVAADASRTRFSMPTERNISSVRMWKNAARGSGELAFRRSIAIERMPCWARNAAADKPTMPPPAIRTGSFVDTHSRTPLCLDEVDPLSVA